MQEEHPFAPWIRILGKGKKGSRSLTLEEAREAMGMILDRQVLPEQLGAFLMLLRIKEETPEELQGFVQAVQQRLQPPTGLRADLVWSTYAGKKRRLPWFFLSALALAGQGTRIFMHGARGHTPGRIYIEDILPLFGMSAARSWGDVETSLAHQGLAFYNIDRMVPVLGDLIHLRPVLGLRSPVHTLCRLLNPLEAPCHLDGVFHPPYAPMHQEAARLLGIPCSLTVRGDGGEAEIRPDGDTELHWVIRGAPHQQRWPRTEARRIVREDSLDPEDLLRLWRGEIHHPYGEGAVIGTLAVALQLLSQGQEGSPSYWTEKARTVWEARDKQAW